MTAYADRERLVLARGTAAVRATLTLGLSELWVDVDGSDVPTGDLWLGDGSTAGGIGPLRIQALVDHGSLLGLADDDHTHYVLVDGSRNVTGAITFDSTVTITGTATNNGSTIMNALTTLTSVQLLSVNPNLILHNYTHTNANDGRSVLVTVGGEKADGTLFYQGLLRWDHDGSGNDQQTTLAFCVNTGSDGFAPTLAMSIDSAHLALFAGEVRHPFARRAQYHVGSEHDITSTTFAAVSWDSTDCEDTGFSIEESDTEVEFAFAGRIEVSFSALAFVDTGSDARIESEFKIEYASDGDAFSDVAGSLRGDSHERASADSTTGLGTVACGPLVLDVIASSRLRVMARKVQSGSDDLAIPADGALLNVRRIQGTS